MPFTSSRKNIYLLEKELGAWSLATDLNHARNFLLQTGNPITHNIFKADVLFSVWYKTLLSRKVYYFLSVLKKVASTKIVTTVTNAIEDTHADDINKLAKLVDCWIVPSVGAYNFLRDKNLNVELIPFYVERDTFKKLESSKQSLCEKLGIDYNEIAGKYLIGSFQRDSLGKNLEQPKWQKNPGLLVQILDKLPRDQILLLLCGPRRHYLVRQCEKLGIPYLYYGDEKYIRRMEDDLAYNNISKDKLGLLYNLIDLYVVSSKSEGGPKAICEASLSKTLIVSTPVGLAPDILHKELIFEEQDSERVADFINNMIQGRANTAPYLEYNYQQASRALDEELLRDKYKSLVEDAPS